MKLGVGFFNDTRSGQLAAQINQNVGGIRDLLSMTLTSVARDAVSLVGAGRGHDLQDPVLSLISLLIGPPLVYHGQLSDAAAACASPANQWRSIRG